MDAVQFDAYTKRDEEGEAAMLNKAAACACLVILIWLSAVLPVEANNSVTPSTQLELEASVDQLMEKQLEELNIPGAVVLVVYGEEMILSRGYGYSNVENQIAMDPKTTSVRIGSLTKSFTATAVMQLVDRRQLDLNRNINDYIGSFQVPLFKEQPISLHHLLTHTAGLDQGMYHLTAKTEAGQRSAEAFLQQYFQEQPPVRAPGARYDYSNVGYGLAGLLIEQVTGQAYNDLMQDQLFEPLKMKSAILGPAESRSYTFDETAGFTPIPPDYLNIPAAGAISLVPNDMAAYMIAHLNEGFYQGQSILSPELVERMHQAQYRSHPLFDGVGYGFHADLAADGQEMVWHTGEVEGFISKLVLYPAAQLGVFVLTNSGDAGTKLHDQVVELITELSLEQSEHGQITEAGQTSNQHIAPTTQLANKPFQQYEGTYAYLLAPEQGWGRSIRLFTLGTSYKVKAISNGLQISGNFPHLASPATLQFREIADQVFQEQNGTQRIWFHEEDGRMVMTGIDKATMERVSWWQQSITLLFIYAGGALFWFIVLLIWLIRYSVRGWRVIVSKKAGFSISRSIMLMSVLFTVYVGFQLLIGIKEMSYGYPLIYSLGITSLPFLAAGLAVYAIISSIKLAKSGRIALAAGKILVSLISLAYTFFLLYWNMLSIHLF